MSFKKSGLGEPCNTLAKTAVKCVLRSALRNYLKHNTQFFALVLVEGTENYSIYEAAAGALLGQSREDSWRSSRVYVEALRTPAKAAKQHFLEALRSHQAVMFTDNLEEVPSDLVVLADCVVALAQPSARHFRIAAMHHGFTGLTEADALFLERLPLRDVDAAVKSRRPLASALRRLKRLASCHPGPAKHKDERKSNDPRTLHTMEGLGRARDWGLQLAADIREWKAGRINWDDMDRGALISGPPGCGKTSFAKALAATCDLPLVLASASRWQAAGHLGDYLKAMRKSFQDAKSQAPSILFLDEFDSFGDRDALSRDQDHADYRRQTINGLLECLDPPEGRQGVIVIGATNFPDKIDPALLRPGRMETVIQIPLPDRRARVAILKQYLGDVAEQTDWAAFADASEGMSGADIEKIARDAKRQYRGTSDFPKEADVLALLPPLTIFSDKDRLQIAVHEIGHAIVGTLLTHDRLSDVSISGHRTSNARGISIGRAAFEQNVPANPTRDYFLGRIALSLAGIAAEKVYFGDHGAGCGGHEQSDLATATDLAFLMLFGAGLGDTLTYLDCRSSADRQRVLMQNSNTMDRVEEVLQTELSRAINVLSNHADAVRLLASQLAQRLQLTGNDVRRVLFATAERNAG